MQEMIELFRVENVNKAASRFDFEKLAWVNQHYLKNDEPLEIVPHDTVREADGLAMSSRNGYLSAAERAEAPTLNRVLRGFADTVRARRSGFTAGEVDALEAAAIAELRGRGWQPDYLTLRRQRDLLAPELAELRGETPLVVLAAAKLGTPRLLDNLEI